MLSVLVCVTSFAGLTDRTLAIQRIVPLYLGGGLLAGSMVGLLHRMAQSRIGAAALGVLVAIPVSVLTLVAVDGSGKWLPGDTVVVIVTSLGLGIPVGIIYREIFSDGG
jgi:hypothetical protein